MTRTMNAQDWQVLRILVRAGGGPLPKEELRPQMSRRSKDGRQVLDLATAGLIYPRGGGYELTEAGRYAAEYGEYAVDAVRKDGKITGWAPAEDQPWPGGVEPKPTERAPRAARR